MLARATLPTIVVSLLISACGGAPPQEPAHPPTQVEPAPPPSAEPAPVATAEPEPAPEPPTLTGGPDFGDGTGEPCSVWSGGPLGDARPPKGYKSGDCPPGKQCVCNAQAGHSCYGVCR